MSSLMSLARVPAKQRSKSGNAASINAARPATENSPTVTSNASFTDVKDAGMRRDSAMIELRKL